jgi:hypothetical protein
VHRYAAVFLLLVLAAPVYAQSELAFPHLALGGSPTYETIVQVINEVEASNSITIEVFNGRLSGSANGTPVAVRFDGGTPATSLSVTLAPYQEFTTLLTTSGTTLINGWLRVRSSLAGGKISGNLIFRQRSGGALIDSVGAPSPQKFRRAVIQIDQREAQADTGIAFVNTEDTPLNVTIDLYQGIDRVATPYPVTLLPRQHFARLISEMFPSFGNKQGTLVLEADPGRQVACMALRLDGSQLTSIPVRPLGIVFQYTVTSASGVTVESGFWMFDMIGFNLVGTGKIESPAAGDFSEVTGSWVGKNFQFRYRKSIGANNIGMVVFNGTSAGDESTTGSDLKPKAVTGKVTTLGSDGQVISVNNFTAFHKYGPPSQ